MHTASYEFLMKPKESAGCHQTLSAQVGSGDETSCRVAWSALTGPFLILVYTNGYRNHSCGSAGSFQSGGEFARQEESSLVGER